MALIENVQTVKVRDQWPISNVESEPESVMNPLDAPDAQERLRKVNDWWHQAQQVQAMPRYEMAVDQDYRDGLQWRDEDKQELINRGQWPLVFNKILPAINWISGTEKRIRVDWKIHPRSEDDIQGADIKTKLLKYTSDVNKTSFVRSRAFDDTITAGVGWLECGIRKDSSNEPLFARYESWKNIWYDHLGIERDLSDCRYLFRSKWLDLDIATAMFPDRAEYLRAAAISHNLFGNDDDEFWWLSGHISNDGRVISRSSFSSDTYAADNRRSRVKLIEAWYREPMSVQLLRGHPRTEGLIFNPDNQYHSDLVKMEYASIFEAIRLQVRCAIFIPGGLEGSGRLLQDMVSPYRHNRFPFIPIWCYRRARDGTPYGPVRNSRDPQDDLNKRRSKALYILSSKGMIADSDAFEDWDEAADELSRPDMILKKKKGTFVELVDDRSLAAEHVNMELQDAKYIQDISGVTDQNEGRQANATSGVAVDKLQYQGSLVTAEIFDNLRYAIQLHGEMELSLIEQFYDFEKVVRLVGPRGKSEFLAINKMIKDKLGKQVVENDITATQADYVVDEQDFHESIRQAIFESMMNLCAQLAPEVAINLLDLVVEMVDIPGKDELVKRIRKLNGQMDPEEQDSPEMQAQAQEQQEAVEAQEDLQQQSMVQTLEEQKAKIQKLLAEVKLTLEKAKTEAANRELDTVKVASDVQNASRESADKGKIPVKP